MADDLHASYYEQYAAQYPGNGIVYQPYEKQGFSNSMTGLLGPDPAVSYSRVNL